MAIRRDSFPTARSRGPQQKYPWQTWADGSVWEIRQGEDYDVPTENMRVNLHMKGDALLQKVRTQKINDQAGEGLVFQFLPNEDMEAVQIATAQDPDAARHAINQLYADALEIYERARAEVMIPRSDGTQQRYAANRYKQQIDKGYDENNLVPTVARIIRKPTIGFNHLLAAGRDDLMLENLVLDTTKPYHHFFSATTIETARERMQTIPTHH
jgi:hypothetical protein